MDRAGAARLATRTSARGSARCPSAARPIGQPRRRPPTRAASRAAAQRVADRAGAALAAGIDPLSDEAAPVVDEIVAAFAAVHGREDGPEYRAWLAELLGTFTDRRAERYWQLLAIVNGWPERPPTVPAWEWLVEALRA